MHRMHFSIDALKNWVKTWYQRETEAGQSIVILVLGLLGLLAFAGLVFDGGTAFAQYRRMQNAADAGALAGAQELSKKNTIEGITNGDVCATVAYYAGVANGKAILGGQTDADIKVQYIIPNPTYPLSYTLKPVPGCHPNGASEGSPGGQPRDDAKGVRVTTSTTFKTFFLGGLMGLVAGTSTAHASAEYGPASPLNVQPLAKRCPPPTAEHPEPCFLNIGHRGPIWQSDDPGNLGWLGFNGNPNTTILRQELDPDAAPVPYIDDVCEVDGVPREPCKNIGLGCWVQGTTGTVSGVDTELTNYWLLKDPMIIVLYDRQLEKDAAGNLPGTSKTCGGGGGGSNAEFHIVGFAAFQLADYDLAGLTQYIDGTFVRWMDASAICKDCADTGLYSVHLIPDVAEPPVALGTKGRICVTVGYDVQVTSPPTFNEAVDYHLAGAKVEIKNSSGSDVVEPWITTGNATTCTDAVFDPGTTYTVIETNPPGYSSTTPDSVDAIVTAGGTIDVLFLDHWPVADTGNIVVLTRDDKGNVLPSLYAQLNLASDLSPRGGPSKSITGTVYFNGRPPGSYIISGVPPGGFDMVNDPPNTYNNITVTISAGSTITKTIVAHQYATGKICVRAWDDVDQDGGDPEAGEKPLWGAVFTLAGTEPRSPHTMGDGEYTYCFENLRTGPYTVSMQHPPGYSSATLPIPSPDSFAFILNAGDDVRKDFRDVVPPRGNLCVQVFDDVTGDGLLTPGEVTLGGAEITVYLGSPPQELVPVAIYVTTGTEPKCFSLGLGTYSIKETKNPPGYLSTNSDERYGLVVVKDMATTIQFADRTSLPTKTPTRTKTPTPTRTGTPPPNTTPTATPTQTPTPLSGALCVTVYEDMNSNGLRDILPAPTGTPTGTPTVMLEPYVAPKNVTVMNSTDITVGTWDGTGLQPKCWSLWLGDYDATETDGFGYGSTTANFLTVSVTAPGGTPASTMAEYGDKLCFAMPPHMRDPIFQSGNQWMLQWDNLPGTFYTIYASDNSIDPEVPTWTIIGELTGINYLVERNQGTFFYVTATDNCGTSGPSNVVRIDVSLSTPTPTPTATATPP